MTTRTLPTVLQRLDQVICKKKTLTPRYEMRFHNGRLVAFECFEAGEVGHRPEFDRAVS